MTYFKSLNYNRLHFTAITYALSKLLFLKISIKISLNFILFFLFAILNLNSFYAQVGIGTTKPDASSILDISSNSKGLLMPRLSTDQRNEISLPATGLMIFNTTLNDGELNIGTPSGPIWVGIKGHLEPTIQSVSLGTSTTTTSTVSELASGMTLSPSVGTYMVLFNGLLSSEQTFSSDQGVVDLNDLHDELTGLSGGVSHIPAFGGVGTNGEVFSPGVYDSTGAITISGTITLDGGNSGTNPVFVFRGPGALTTAVNTKIRLINGANANNVFWVATGAITTGAATIMKGTLFSSSTVALGADTDIEGRMFSKTAALSMGANSIVSSPSDGTDIDLGVLSSFVMFTAAGAISGSCTGCITGDVGTALGATSAFDGIKGTVYGPGTEASDPGVTTYGIYQNGVEVANSSRVVYTLQSVVSLQALVSVTIENSPIEVRWKVDQGEAKLLSRILSLIRSHY